MSNVISKYYRRVNQSSIETMKSRQWWIINKRKKRSSTLKQLQHKLLWKIISKVDQFYPTEPNFDWTLTMYWEKTNTSFCKIVSKPQNLLYSFETWPNFNHFDLSFCYLTESKLNPQLNINHNYNTEPNWSHFWKWNLLYFTFLQRLVLNFSIRLINPLLSKNGKVEKSFQLMHFFEICYKPRLLLRVNQYVMKLRKSSLKNDQIL